jgi:NAD(P)-dependent dehydrogenase (short-subunit alcohol dehydrogenase family)
MNSGMTDRQHGSTGTVVITGGNTGLGYECARAIATSGEPWHVVLACRSEKKAAGAVRKLAAGRGSSPVEAMALDLASLASVRRFAGELAARDLPPLRAVICNAGIQIVTGVTYTEDGFETTFGVNHLGHFLLVNLLLRQVVPPARIVFVSSGTHDPENKTWMPPPRFMDAKSLARPEPSADSGESPAITGGRRYSTSKLCNILCAYELARRLQAEGLSTPERPITVNAFNPGLMPGTDLARGYSPAKRFAWYYILPYVLPLLRLLHANVNSIEASGRALARLVLDPELEGVTGRYFDGRKEIRSSAESYDEKKAAELWEASADLVGLPRTLL